MRTAFEQKPCEATLSPPIFASRYEDREAAADRVNRAICSATRSRTNAVRVRARSLLERARFAKQVSMIYYNGTFKFKGQK